MIKTTDIVLVWLAVLALPVPFILYLDSHFTELPTEDYIDCVGEAVILYRNMTISIFSSNTSETEQLIGLTYAGNDFEVSMRTCDLFNMPRQPLDGFLW